MLARIGNRENGNAPRHCVVLALYEDGSECQDNMIVTVFSNKYPLRRFLQKLLDDKLTAVIVKVLDGNGKVLECAVVLVQLSDIRHETDFIPTNVEVELVEDEYG